MKGIIQAVNGSSQSRYVRLIIFRVTHADASAPTVATAELGVLDSANVQSFRSMTSGNTGRNRYIIHYDKVFKVSPFALDKDDKVYVNYYKKFNHKVVFPGSAGSNAMKNDMFMLLIGDGVNLPTATLNFRARYVDN